MKVYQALQASRFLPKLAGAAPYNLSNTRIQFSRFGQIWPFIKLPIIVTLLYVYRSNIPYQFNDIKNLLMSITIWLQYFIATYSVLKDGFCQQSMVDIVQSIDNYDEKTGYHNDATGNRENKRVRFWSFMFTGLLIVLTIGKLSVRKTLVLDPASEIFVIQIENSMYMFAVFTTLLGLRLRHLNTMLEQDLGIKVQNPGSETVANPEYVRVLYTSLVGIGERLNDYYSSRLFLWTALTILGFITRYYYLLTVEVSALFVTVTVIRLLPAILGLMLFSMACQFTSEQVNRTPAILLEKNIRHTAVIDRGRKVSKHKVVLALLIRQEIFTMSLYMTMQPFEFSALGFFTVDHTLISAVFTVTLTYLTLCLQTGN